MWKKTLWRRVDLKEKQNKPYFARNREMSKIIIEAVERGVLIPYNSDSVNDSNVMAREEFIENIRKFSGVDVNKLKHFNFTAYKKGGFQLPHIHNAGDTTLIIMIYFSKNWPNGDPGGTYMTPEEDEASIIFEPNNLDNSMAIFHDGPNSGHGVRYISKDVERRAIQIYYENYSEKSGWSDILNQERHRPENLREL